LFEVDLPFEMSREQLDRRLAEGWFRSGPVFFRADLLAIDEAIRGLLQVRLPLDREAASRSQRRLLRRNRERFRCVIGPAQVDADRQRLYDATKHRFMGFVCSQVDPLVFGAQPGAIDTRECCVYDGDRLIAVSYFDVGRTSLASQLGLHDPEYARFSLGFYTMLEEIDFARGSGLRYFYPGYVIPGLPALDYKLRIGAVQYLDRGGRWRRRANPPRQVRSALRHERRVAALGRALCRESVLCERRFYPGFWLGHLAEIGSPEGNYLCAMVHFRCGPESDDSEWLVVEYDGDEDLFVMSRVCADDSVDLMEESDPFDSWEGMYELRALVYQSVLMQSESEREIARAARKELL
jgi:arginine-tRNA-protein transferase